MLNEERIALLVLIIVVGFSIAVAYHYIMGYYLDKPWPANSFLHLPIIGTKFNDFTAVVRQSATLDPFGEDIGGFAGSPFAQFVGYLFSLVQPVWLRLAIFFGSFFAVFVPLVKHHLYGLKARLTSDQLLAIFAIVFLTYPVLFAVDRANFDLLGVPCLFLFAFTYERRKYKTSTVFLALAIALKPYTAVFILVYFFDRRYRDTLLAVFNVVFLTVLSLSLFKDGLFVETQKYFQSLSSNLDYRFAQPTFATDLWSLLTIVVKFVGDMLEATVFLPAHPGARIAYTIVAFIVLIYFVIHLWKEPRTLWRTMAVLTILLVLLPNNSHDYRLTYLFVPMLMYMAVKDRTQRALPIIILWGLLLIPKNYYTINTVSSEPNSVQNLGMIINPLLLIGLLVCILPEAFSLKGISSTTRFVCKKLQSIGPIRKLENPRSS